MKAVGFTVEGAPNLGLCKGFQKNLCRTLAEFRNPYRTPNDPQRKLRMNTLEEPPKGEAFSNGSLLFGFYGLSYEALDNRGSKICTAKTAGPYHKTRN